MPGAGSVRTLFGIIKSTQLARAMRRFQKLRSVTGLLPAFGLVATLSCSDDMGVGPTQNEPPSSVVLGLSEQVPAGAVQAAVIALPPAPDGTVTFVVRVIAKDVGVGAYQGVVGFERGTMDLVSVSTAMAAQGAGIVLNPAEFQAGAIRFGSWTASAFPGTNVGDGIEAFRFTVRMLSPMADANVRATLVAVGGGDGEPIAQDLVLASPGVFSITGQLVR
jgi:hypothetical protein